MVTYAEIKPATVPQILVMRERETIIKPQRSEHRNVDAQANAPVVVVKPAILAGILAALNFSRTETVGLRVNISDVIEHGEAKPFNNRDAVLGRAKPVGVAAQRFAKFVLRTDVAITVAAQRI